MEIKYIAIVCSILLLVFMLFKEFQRPNKRWLILRLITSFLAVFSFLFFIIPIHYQVKQRVKPEEISFLTANTNPDSVEQKAKWLTSDSSVLKSFGRKVNFIPDLNYYLAAHPDVKTIQLYGEGLSEAALKRLKPRHVNFHPSSFPSGIQSCIWNHQLRSTEELQVQGVYQNDSKKSVKLLLNGLGASIDSVEIKPESSLNFDLKAQPKQIGKATYQLLAIQSKDILANEVIPFFVDEEKIIKVLILAAYPDFEYKFLKNWLLENHYPVTYRSRISKDKFSIDYINTQSNNLNQIDTQVLNNFDLIIADDLELANLTGSESSALANQIANGKGLLIRLNEEKLNSSLARRFSLSNTPSQKDKSYVFSISGKEMKTKPLHIANSIHLAEHSGDFPLVKDVSSKIWASSQLYGAGKIVITTIPNAYGWFLGGDQADYATYWSTLIKNAIIEQRSKIGMSIHPQFPVVNQRMNIQIENDAQVPQMSVDESILAPLQNKLNPSQWEGDYWPVKVGWDSVKVNSSTIRYFYVNPSDSWKGVRQLQKIKETQSYVQNQLTSKQETTTIEETEERTLSKWWFLFLFLLSAGFLWYESRLSE